MVPNKFNNINKQYKDDLTKKPLKKIEKAVGDSTWAFNNQKWNGTKGIFIPKPISIIIKIVCISKFENLYN